MKYRPLLQTVGLSVTLLANTACLNAQTDDPALTLLGDHIRFEGARADLATTSNGRHVFVTGYFGDKGPYNIIVDTGAGPNVIDSELAKEWGLDPVGKREVLSGGVEPVEADIVIVPEMRVDGLSIENAEFITLGLGAMSLGQFHGVLGMELFNEALLTFDLRQDRISVSKGNLTAGEPGVIAYSNNDGDGLNVDIDAAGQTVKMHLDTGAPGRFTFPYALRESLPLAGPLESAGVARLVGGERAIWRGELDGEIKFAGRIYKNPEIMFIDPSSPFGNIGNSVLGELVLTIDQKNGLLSFENSAAPKPAIEQSQSSTDQRRIGIQFRGMGGGALTIAKVEEGSLAEKAGFKTGDKLMKINGKLMAEYDMPALGALFRGWEPLQIEIERDGETRIIAIQ